MLRRQDFLAQTEARLVRGSSTLRVACSLVCVRTEFSNADLMSLGMFCANLRGLGGKFSCADLGGLGSVFMCIPERARFTG